MMFVEKQETFKRKGRVWRSFFQARAFVHALGLKSTDEWLAYCKSGEKPLDIPSNPSAVYQSEYKGTGDWLGTGSVASSKRHYRPFVEARAFVHTLKLKDGNAWNNYSKSGQRPSDIPSNPDKVYRSEYIGMGDWLGTGTIASSKRHYRPFSEARAFVHTLKFKSSNEWRIYCKSGNKPNDIPAFPNQTPAYRSEYKDWGDWLGTGNISPTKLIWQPFAEARAYARSLELKNIDEWLAYCKSGKKPADIPTYPHNTYLADFESYGDWLGTGTIALSKRRYRPFSEARSFVHTLGLKNSKQWYSYCTSGEKPLDIPSHVSAVYPSEYKDMGDWLGTGRTYNYRPFTEARAVVRSLELKSEQQWIEYCKSGMKPPDIPSNPRRRYRGEYKNIADWLGVERFSFSEARSFVHTLGLKNSREWEDYCKSGMKPAYIPSNPSHVYSEEYKGLKDWLGITDTWNNKTLLAFLYDLQPKLGYLNKKDLVTILEQDGLLNAYRRVLGNVTPQRILNDLLHHRGNALEQALKETEEDRKEVEIVIEANSTETKPVRDQVFICYSRKNKIWLEKLQIMLAPLTRERKIKIWADTQIVPGETWREEISKALEVAKVAVLLVSPDFLHSDFIAEHELPPLLEAAKQDGLVILWIAVSPSLYEETEIAHYQAVNEPSRSLAGLRGVKLNEELVQICKKIKEAMTR